MPDTPIPEEVKRFLAEHVESAEQLDTLVLLHNHPARAWTAEEVSQAIYTVPQAAAKTLARLEETGLVAGEGGSPPAWRYAPGPQLHPSIAALADTYRTQRVAVVKHLYASRVDPVRSFADAFRLKKDR